MRERLRGAFQRAFRAFAVGVISLLARALFGARVCADGGAIDDNALFLCAHESVWDFAFLIYALRPRRVRFVATSIEFEKSRFTAWLLTSLGVIQKKQGATDISCVRQMVRAAREGDVVAVYPAGMTSCDGRPAWKMQPGTGKLARLMGASVYAATPRGAFLSHPRYAHTLHRGRVDVYIQRLFTAEEARKTPPEAIQAAAERALAFDEWRWQAKERVRFHALNRARGVTRALYMCPHCGMYGGMRELSNAVTCDVCGMRAEIDEYGFFRATRNTCTRRMDKWVDMELDKLRQELAADDFALYAPVTLKRPRAKAPGYETADEGELRLTKTELRFSSKTQTLSWTFADFQYLVMNDVDFLHINAVNGAYRFVFADPRPIMRWFFAHRMLVGGQPEGEGTAASPVMPEGAASGERIAVDAPAAQEEDSAGKAPIAQEADGERVQSARVAVDGSTTRETVPVAREADGAADVPAAREAVSVERKTDSAEDAPIAQETDGAFKADREACSTADASAAQNAESAVSETSAEK